MNTVLERVTEELKELHQKNIKLRDFMATDPAFYELSSEHKNLLDEQYMHMVQYRQILSKRVKLLEEEKECLARQK